MKMTKKQLLTTLSIVSILSLSACDNSDDVVVDDDPIIVDFSYEVTVTNLTHSQPLSPIAVVSHEDISLWEIGDSASVALETMAESGNNSEILANSALISGSSGTGIILPGMSETLVFTSSIELGESVPFLSVATMLVNTNDAFTGITGIDVSSLAIGENVTMNAVAYDAGTEANSEVAGTVPGPADGGEGFNATRDDVDYVAQHPGIVGLEDGLSTSVLTTEHKFDNPVIQLSITRL